ncbi:UDP-2,3-diacylglucosamine diphosphatase [Comamonas testosteroni]|uniref:UDP-2,3-diacylglucosamine hydrolase n=1 Tax=Comamonas testosteroni TaxID=285 RepID=A0A373FMK6_COMTE|nr:UDP-2,3-diacylglucosamine diphosphatase [Comamonas testosteroni]RGE45157.1 UDP-2,3-diacylglucosamine diphosphatase [Comamonas testosteroni]
MIDPSDPRSTAPFLARLQGDANWRVIDFISDLHLQPSEPQTVQAWRDYLQRSSADAIFMLGDLFEVWVGDDALDEPGSFEAECAAWLHEAAQKRPLFFMVGNRDFLAGDEFLRRSGMTGLADPTALHWAGPHILLSHGDALCLDDVEYQQFRAVSRSAAWQQQLLSQPLAVRRAIGKSARSESEQRKQSGAPYADADAQMTGTWMQAAQAPWLIHGHTHQPADHALEADQWRIVLSDWHIEDSTRRAEVLRVTPQGWQRLAPEQA